MTRAITVGGAMLDTIAIIESDRIERMTMLNADTSFLLLAEGQKTEALEVSAHCGGGAINAAVAMARLGIDVSVLVKLGQDQRAETILARLLTEGVSTRWVLRDARAPTGASVLVSSHDRNAAVFTFRGANTLLEPTDLRRDAFAVDAVYVTTLSNASADCFPIIVDEAHRGGAFVVANPGVRQLSARGSAFQETLPKIDVLSINRQEASVLVPSLVGRFGEGHVWPEIAWGPKAPRLSSRGLAGGGYTLSLAGFFGAMRDLGTRAIVLTDGRAGSYTSTEREIYYCPALETVVAGTAGAGDAFTSTFTAMKLLGRQAAAALQAATINSSSVVEFVDTQSGLLSLPQIDRRLAEAEGRLAVCAWQY